MQPLAQVAGWGRVSGLGVTLAGAELRATAAGAGPWHAPLGVGSSRARLQNLV